MSAMENSLRRALDAGDASDPAFRESIYAASERALERMLSERPMDEAAAQAQRIRLAETINRVEQDYYQAAEAGLEPTEGFVGEDPAGPEEGREPGGFDGPATKSDEEAVGGEPMFPANGTKDARPAPVLDDEAPAFLRRPPDPVVDRSKVPAAVRAAHPAQNRGFGGGGKAPSGLFRPIFALVVLLAFAILAYLVYGMIYGPTTTEPAAGPTTSEAAPSDGAGLGGGATLAGDVPRSKDDGRWIALFDGTQLASIATPTGGRVETVTGSDERPAVRMSSAEEGGEIEVAVGPGVARELAGETVRVEVTVGSPDGEPREFGVRCLFSGKTVCGTQRFTTMRSSEAFVFDMVVPRGARSAGSIAFEPGYGDGGRPLDLYAVRARLSDAA